MSIFLKIESIRLSPKKLFLIDGLGALLSAFILGVVFVKLETTSGIPASTLYVLAVIPVIISIFDFYCYQKQHDRSGWFLKIIATVNLLYCCLSIGFAIYHIATITILGWVYILIESLIILLLSVFELSVAKSLLRSKRN